MHGVRKVGATTIQITVGLFQLLHLPLHLELVAAQTDQQQTSFHKFALCVEGQIRLRKSFDDGRSIHVLGVDKPTTHPAKKQRCLPTQSQKTKLCAWPKWQRGEMKCVRSRCHCARTHRATPWVFVFGAHGRSSEGCPDRERCWVSCPKLLWKRRSGSRQLLSNSKVQANSASSGTRFNERVAVAVLAVAEIEARFQEESTKDKSICSNCDEKLHGRRRTPVLEATSGHSDRLGEVAQRH